MERNSANKTHPHNKTLIDVDIYTDSIQHILISYWGSLETILHIVFFATHHGNKRRDDRLKTEEYVYNMPHRWGWETSCLPRTIHRKKTQHHDRLPGTEEYVRNIPHKDATQSLDDCRKHNAMANNHNAIADKNQIPIPQNTRHKTTRMLCRTALLIPSRYFKRI